MYPSFFQIYIDDKMRWVNEEAGIYCRDYKNGHYQVQRHSKDRFTFVQKKTNVSVSSLMIDKLNQNLSALKVHCFCDCKERRHY